MSKHNIVHISPTPLVGSPGKIAHAQRIKGKNSIAVVLSDYPQKGPLAGFFLQNSLLFNEFTKKYIERSIKEAEIIHIHNYLSEKDVEWLGKLNIDANYVYQAHSPLREGPLYFDRVEKSLPFEFKAKLVVGQHWGRFYPDYTHVPNIILSPPSLKLRKPGEKLRVMFSPTHKHSGRWTDKHSKALTSALQALSSLKRIELLSPERPVHPEMLLQIRRSCHVSIDEIATGGFHMVSLEAFCTGNIAINKADFFAKNAFSAFSEGEMPPFLYADDLSIVDLISKLADDHKYTINWQKKGYEFFEKFCDPRRLIEFYDAAYEFDN